MPNIQPHHVNFVLHLIDAGLIDLSSGTVHEELLAKALASRAQGKGPAPSETAPRKTPIRASQPISEMALDALHALAGGPLPPFRFDGRVLRTLQLRGLVERYMESSPAAVRAAYDKPDLGYSHPVALLRITDKGRAAIS